MKWNNKFRTNDKTFILNQHYMSNEEKSSSAESREMAQTGPAAERAGFPGATGTSGGPAAGSAAGGSPEGHAKALIKYGGFAVVETTIEGAQNLNPEKKARKKIFLSEDAKKEERTALKRRLELLVQLLDSSDSAGAALEKAQEKIDTAQNLLNKNFKT